MQELPYQGQSVGSTKMFATKTIRLMVNKTEVLLGSIKSHQPSWKIFYQVLILNIKRYLLIEVSGGKPTLL